MVKKLRQRERNVAHTWADKQVLRFLRKCFDKKDYRKLRDVYLALCEIDSDFTEERESEVKSIHNITKTCATYAGMDLYRVTKSLQVLKILQLVDYGRKTNKSGRIIGSRLVMFEWKNKDFHLTLLKPYKGGTINIKNTLKGRFVKNDSRESKDSFSKKRKRLSEKVLHSSKKTLIRLPTRKPSLFLNYSPEAESLFKQWNSLGPPLRTHQEKITKIFTRAMSNITKVFNNGSSYKEISRAMKLYHRIVSVDDTVLTKSTPGHIVNLSDFFKFTARTKERMRKQQVDLPIKSWFDECLKGWSHLKKEYGLYVKDKYPTITENFIELWKERKEAKELSVKEMNIFCTNSILFHNFYEKSKNDVDFDGHTPEENVGHAFECMDGRVDGDWDKVEATWFASSKMYEYYFPNYLKEMGMLIDDKMPDLDGNVSTLDEMLDEYDDCEEDVEDLVKEFA